MSFKHLEKPKPAENFNKTLSNNEPHKKILIKNKSKLNFNKTTFRYMVTMML